MPINLAQGGPIPNYQAPSNAQRQSAHGVIAQLQYADLWRGAGTLRTDGVMRVDMQGQIAGQPPLSNIQVQINNLQGHSTVAHANVSQSIMTNDPQNQQGAVNKVIAALNLSLDNARSYLVDGTNP